MTINNMNQLSRTNNSRIRKIEEHYYLINKGECYQLNEIGALIVNAVGKDLPMDRVYSRLSEIYGFDDLDTIAKDVNNYVRFLLKENLVKII